MSDSSLGGSEQSVLRITVDDLRGEPIARFLEEHIEDMLSVSPPESKHALDLEGLRHPSITFWTVWQREALVGCGALKMLSEHEGELKSMRTDAKQRGAGMVQVNVDNPIVPQLAAVFESGSFVA